MERARLKTNPHLHKQTVAWYVPLALALLPLGSIALGVALTLPLLVWLSKSLGIADHEPLIEHPNGTVFLIAMLTCFVACILIGVLLGSLLTAKVLQRRFGLNRAAARGVVFRQVYPESWLHSRPLFPSARPLPWNFTIPDYLQPRPALALYALPGTLAFTCLFIWDVYWDASTSDDRTLFSLAIPFSCVIAGWHLGWLVNGLVSRYVYKWAVADLRAVYLRSELPEAWLKMEKCSDPKAYWKQRHLKDLETRIAVGRLRYVVTRGVVLSGAALFVFVYVTPKILGEESLTGIGALVYAIPCAIGGAALGEVYWRSMQRNLKWLKSAEQD